MNRNSKSKYKKSSTTSTHDLPKNIAILFSDVKREYFPTEDQFITEKDAHTDAKLVADYLRKLATEVKLIPGNSKISARLLKYKPNMVINLVDSVKGQENLASAIPGVLEILDIPYTGGDILGLSLTSNKFLVKKLQEQNGIPVPNYQLMNSQGDILNPTLRFPLISKLNEIHGAVEINLDAVSENEKHLRERVKYLITTYKQGVIVEEFIVGREITAILMEGLNKKVYLAEKVFKKSDRKYIFQTFEDQWLSKEYDTYHYEKYDDPILKEYIKKAFDVNKMYDYGKFDIRLDQSGRYFFIDSNCNPAFGPKEAGVAISSILDMYGVSFTEILKRLLLNTMRDAQGKERLPLPEGNKKDN